MNKPDGGGANTKMRRDVVALSAGRQKHTNFADLILAQFRAALLRPANPIPTKNPEAVFNILLRRCPLKVWQSVIGPVSILMVALIQSCSNSVKRIQHQAVNLFRSALQIHTEVAILIHRRFKNSAIGAATGKVTFNPSEITDAVLPIKPHNWFPSFIHVALLLLSHLLCNSIYAANPAFTDFNATQFDVSGNKVSIKSGALITNLSYLPLTGGVLTGNVLGGGTADLGSPGSRFHDMWLGHNGDILGTLFVAGEATFSNPGNSQALRTDSNGKLKSMTIGSGLSFDGTTLMALGTSAGSTQFISYQITTNSIFVTGKGDRLTINNILTIVTNGVVTFSNFPAPSLLVVGADNNLTNAALVGLSLSNNTLTASGGGGVSTNFWTTLGMSGTNVTGFNPGPGTNYFKLLLTNNAWFGLPTTLPTTNTPFDVTIWIQQGGGGTNMFTVGWTNASYDFGFGLQPIQSTNANARDIYTLTTDPFTNGLFAVVQTPDVHH